MPLSRRHTLCSHVATSDGSLPRGCLRGSEASPAEAGARVCAANRAAREEGGAASRARHIHRFGTSVARSVLPRQAASVGVQRHFQRGQDGRSARRPALALTRQLGRSAAQPAQQSGRASDTNSATCAAAPSPSRRAWASGDRTARRSEHRALLQPRAPREAHSRLPSQGQCNPPKLQARHVYLVAPLAVRGP